MERQTKEEQERVGGVSPTEADALPCSVRADQLPHVAPTIWALWMPFKKNGFPVIGTFGKTERKVVIIPMETWNALCAEIPALQTKQFNVGVYE